MNPWKTKTGFRKGFFKENGHGLGTNTVGRKMDSVWFDGY